MLVEWDVSASSSMKYYGKSGYQGVYGTQIQRDAMALRNAKNTASLSHWTLQMDTAF